jgi:F-type H+-transporting ATPase subunit b
VPAGWVPALTLTLTLIAGRALAGEGGGGLPQLDPATVPTQLFWLAVSFLVLYYMLFGVALPRVESVLQERDSRIAFDVVKADELRAEADAVLAAAERLRDQARSQGQELVARTGRVGLASNRLLMAELDVQLMARIKDAEARILAAKLTALAQIDEVAAEAARELAARLAGVRVDDATMAALVGQVARDGFLGRVPGAGAPQRSRPRSAAEAAG